MLPIGYCIQNILSFIEKFQRDDGACGICLYLFIIYRNILQIIISLDSLTPYVLFNY